MGWLGATMAMLLCAACVAAGGARAGRDPRNIRTGSVIPSESYADHPFLIRTTAGNWLCVLTTGKGREGSPSQHVVATISSDRGRSWSDLIPIEPSGPPESSWPLPLKTPSGRVYVFYTFNIENRRLRRSDTVGEIVFRYSDDHGRTWSHTRTLVPSRRFEIDRTNTLGGDAFFIIPFCKPRVIAGCAMFSGSKHGDPPGPSRSEVAFWRSPNILTEDDPSAIQWINLPEGDHGLRAPRGPISEECTFDVLSDGRSLYAVHRSVDGYLLASISRDLGRTWRDRQYARYAPGDRPIKNPRGPAIMRKLSNGKFLLLFYNNSLRGYQGRNPYWLTGGIQKDGTVHWAEPEIALYDPDPDARPGYADFYEGEDAIYVVETQKSVARVHKLDPTMLQALWRQPTNRSPARRGILLARRAEQLEDRAAVLDQPLDLTRLDGLTVGLWLELSDLAAGQALLDSRDQAGRGLAVLTEHGAALRLVLNDGEHQAAWSTDPDLIKPRKQHHVVFIVDAGPRVISVVVDGRLCDGGTHRAYGWARYEEPLGDVAGSGRFRAAPSVRALRLYGRYLLTSEAVGNYRAGIP